MTRRRKGRRGQAWEPEEVLAGKVEIGARELAELIQRVNPTDRNLPLAEVTQRYRLKNQLQSLLVRRFGDEVEVSAEREGVALLAHRPSGKSACHARLAELDDDARSWVQRRLDEAAAPDVAADAQTPARAFVRTDGRKTESRSWPADAAPPPGEPPVAELPGELPAELSGELPAELSGDELLARGDEAMAAYDYELARHAYERALAASRGDLPAATALLALLVEHLAAYDDAAALWPRLSPAAAGDGRVRTLVALAAAHAGQEAHARELVRGLERDGEGGRESHAAAEVYLVLARRALQREDEDGEAARALSMARQLGGPGQALLDLERELGAQVARRCAPLEAQAQDAFDAGRTDEAEQRARDVLARWPESRAARALLSRIEAGRRNAQVDALLARADAAMEKQDRAAAVGLLRQAAALDGGRGDIASRLARAEAAARDHVAQAQVAEVEALFAAERLDAGLVAYLGLSDLQRARVRGSHPSPMLTWLEEIGAPLAGARAHAVAQSVQALARACAALARGDGHAAEAESAPHEKILRRVTIWRTVRQEAAEMIARSERARAHEQLARAVALFDAGHDLVEIRALVEGIDARRLADAAALDDLRARLAHAESHAQLEARIERALARGDLLEAREAAGAGLAQARDHERPGWQRRHDDIAAHLRRAWCIHSVPGDGQRPMLDTLGLDSFHLARSAMLTPDGAALLVAISLRCWLFLRVVSTRSAQVEQYVLLRTPAPLRASMLHIHDGVVTLAGKQGKILQLAWGTWDVLAWRDLTAFVGEHERFDSCLLVAGAPFVWLSAGAPNGSTSHVVIDLERWCVHRSLPSPMLQPKRVGGSGSPLLLLDFITGRRGLHDAGGNPVPSYRLPATGLVDLAVLHPRDRGLLVLVRTYRDHVATLQVRWLSPDGEELAAVEIDSRHHNVEYYGSDRDRGLIFLVCSRTYPERELVVLATDDGLRIHHRIALPASGWMLQDADGTHRRFVTHGPAGLTITPIDGEPRRLPDAAPKARRLEMHGHLLCGDATPATDPHLLAFRGSVLPMENEELTRNLRALQRNQRMDARMWADVVATLSRCFQLEVCDEFISWAQARFPEQADLALDAAQHHARMRRWPEALALLDAIEPRKLEPRRLRHMHHLRGVVLFLGGRPGDAHAAWTQGLACAAGEHDECDLQSCIELVAPVDLDAGDEHRALTGVGQTRRCVLQADRCLARGDVSGALAAVDHEHVWQGRETQSFARLARVYLESEDQGPVHRFHQLLALAAFDAGCEPDVEHYFSQRLPIPDAALSDEELQALAERVRVRLDEYAQRLSAEPAGPR